MLLVLRLAGLRPASRITGMHATGGLRRAISLPAEMIATGGKHLILCRTPAPHDRRRPIALGFAASQVLEVLQPQALQPVPLATAEVWA